MARGIRKLASGAWAVVELRQRPGCSEPVVRLADEYRGVGAKRAAIQAAGTNRVV